MSATCGIRVLFGLLGVFHCTIYRASGMSGRLWSRYIKVKCNKCCMSCHCKNIWQLLVHCEDVWPIGTLSIETSPDPSLIKNILFVNMSRDVLVAHDLNQRIWNTF